LNKTTAGWLHTFKNHRDVKPLIWHPATVCSGDQAASFNSNFNQHRPWCPWFATQFFVQRLRDVQFCLRRKFRHKFDMTQVAVVAVANKTSCTIKIINRAMTCSNKQVVTWDDYDKTHNED